MSEQEQLTKEVTLYIMREPNGNLYLAFSDLSKLFGDEICIETVKTTVTVSVPHFEVAEAVTAWGEAEQKRLRAEFERDCARVRDKVQKHLALPSA